MKSYQIDQQGIRESDEGNLFILDSIADDFHIRKTDFLDRYELPEDIFKLDDYEPIAPRYEKIDREGDDDIYVLVLVALETDKSLEENQFIEDRLSTVNIIFNNERIFVFSEFDDYDVFEKLVEKYKTKITTNYEWLTYFMLEIYEDFIEELFIERDQIKQLNEEAEFSTGKHTITRMTNIKHNLIIIQHTLEVQSKAVVRLLNNSLFQENTSSELIYDIKWMNTKAKEFSELNYKILSGLSDEYNSHMSRNLNELMKWLNSVAIILSTAGMIFGLWGINTGGLFFKDHEYGFVIVILVSIVSILLMIWYLKNHDFSE